MSPTPRHHRIEQLLGARLGPDLPADVIRRFVEDGIREDADLDFKRTLYPQDGDGRDELAKDVAAMANTRGGVILLGIEERDEVAVAAPGVTLGSDEEQRIRAIIKSRIRPLLPGFEILQVSGDDLLQGFFLLVVGVSELKPHLVVAGSSSKPLLLYPRRFGAQSLWLGEAELADAYRNRSDAARNQQDRLEAVHSEGLDKLWTEDTAWLVATLVPDVADSMRLTNAALEAVDKWGHDLSPELFTSTRFGSVIINNRAVGLRRILLSVNHMTAASLARGNYAQLHLDGAGFAAVELVNLRQDEQEAQIALGWLVAELLAMLAVLTRHAVDNAGVSGDGILQVELIEPDRRLSKGRRMRLGEERYPPSTTLTYISGAVDLDRLPPARHTIPIDAVASNPIELVAAARLLLADLTSGFGLAEPPQLTVDGQIDLQAFGTLQGAARAWSERHGLPTI